MAFGLLRWRRSMSTTLSRSSVHPAASLLRWRKWCIAAHATSPFVRAAALSSPWWLLSTASSTANPGSGFWRRGIEDRMIQSLALSYFLLHRPFGQLWLPCFCQRAQLFRSTAIGAIGTSGTGQLKSQALHQWFGKRSSPCINAVARSGALHWRGNDPSSSGTPYSLVPDWLS